MTNLTRACPRGVVPAFTTCLVLFLMCGCSRWESMSQWEPDAYWSDNDEEVVAIKSYFEGKRELSFLRKREFSHEIYSASASDLGNVNILRTVQPGRVQRLYSMHSAGYLVVGRWLEPQPIEGGPFNGSTRREVIFEKISANGGISQIATVNGLTMLSCDGISATSTNPLDVIPSPDGSLLALTKHFSDCSTMSFEVSILNAADLSQVVGPITIDWSAFVENGEGFPGVSMVPSFVLSAWSADGKFLVRNAGNSPTTWSLAPGEEPEWVTHVTDECMFPETSSSHISSGQHAVQVMDDGTIESNFDDNAMIFGCP